MPRFANHPIDGQIEWPAQDAKFTFGPWEIWAFPPSAEHDATLHLDIEKAGTPGIPAMTVLNRVLSIASWLDDNYAVLLPGWEGNPVPARPARTTKSWPSSILPIWCNYWQPISDPMVARALAIYREALNMLHFHSQPYAVLGFYKILELTIPPTDRITYIAKASGDLLQRNWIESLHLRAIGFAKTPTPEAIAKRLRDEGRHAVAHAQKAPSIDPDEISDQHRMSAAAYILQSIARRYINTELKVGLSRWDQNDLKAEF